MLKQLPPGLLDGLPDEDKQAITAIVGNSVLLTEYDEDRRAELEFFDYENDAGHYIRDDPKFITPWST